MFIMLLFSTGDDVFVKSDQEKPAIYRIEKLWIDARYADIWLAILKTLKLSQTDKSNQNYGLWCISSLSKMGGQF